MEDCGFLSGATLRQPCVDRLAAAIAGEERVKARTYAALTIALSLLTTGLLLKISEVQSAFSSALSEKAAAEFYGAVWSFVAVICLAAPLFAVNEYVDSRIKVEWRSWLARKYGLLW